MFDEIDYVQEAKNAERFASLYSFDSSRFSFQIALSSEIPLSDTIYL